MNCLKIDPTLLIKTIRDSNRDHNYTSLDLLKEYNLPVSIYYDYFISIEKYKLKNLWNHVIRKWNYMKRDLSENSSFITSELCLGSYNQIHRNIEDEEFNNLLCEFINDNEFKALFICNCIQNYILPK